MVSSKIGRRYIVLCLAVWMHLVSTVCIFYVTVNDRVVILVSSYIADT